MPPAVPYLIRRVSLCVPPSYGAGLSWPLVAQARIFTGDMFGIFPFLLIFNHPVDFLGVPSVVGSGCATAAATITQLGSPCCTLVVDGVHQGLRLTSETQTSSRVKAKQRREPSN